MKRPTSLPDPELETLRRELRQAQGELTAAYNSFDQAVDPQLVESCIYLISSLSARCDYLLRSIKDRTSCAIPACREEDALWT